MKKHVQKLSEGVYWVGVKDWNRRIFDALIPLPQGTTYNAYLVVGEGSAALIDTVNPGFEREMAEKINQITEITELDYVVMNHAEPDHAGAIPYVMESNKRAVLITTERGAKMASTYYNVPEDRIMKVKDGDAVNLGGKTLKFIEAPWLHWPETMFTYLAEDKILFPCDYFGAHTAFGFYDEDVEEILAFAKRYFGEIMMPFRNMGARALEKIKELDIDIIAPSHGPVYKNPKRIIDAYRKWTAGETEEKAVLVYVSMWKATESMMKSISEILLSEGIEVSIHDLSIADIGDIARDLVDSSAIVLGAPTVLGGMHPLAIFASYLVRALRPPLKYAVVLSSYGWGGGAVKQALEILGPAKIEVVASYEINGPPSEEDHERIAEIGKTLSEKIKKR
jgi:flavorubredoxin